MSAVKLNIGSRKRASGQDADGWKTLDIDPGPEVDFVGDCCDLAQFADNSVAALYASHVLEHLSYQGKVQAALAEWFRVLVPGGTAMIAVPDMEMLCRLYLHPGHTAEQRFEIMRVMFGGQLTPFDFHAVGLNLELLSLYLLNAGFQDIARVESFGLFKDFSEAKLGTIPVSLNVTATKPKA